MISVIIPLYNKKNQISHTLNSVLSQSFTDYEIVIIDDGSTDNGPEEVLKFQDERIRLIHQENAGVSAARNHGIKEARYDLIAFLDADDEWMPDYLQTQYELSLKYPNCNVFACNYEFKDLTGKVTNTIINKIRFSSTVGILDNYFEIASCSHPPLWTSAVTVRKSAIESIGGFPTGVKSGEDLLTWARLAVNYRIAYSKEVRACYNLGEGYDYSKQPPRRQDANDYVGEELNKLYMDHPGIKGLRKYISLWHKMRASVAIRFGDRAETILESIKALKFNPLNIKVLLFIVLAILPSIIQKKIIASYK